MGIPTDPADDEYGNDAGLCFLPNKTPKFIYATFARIIAGPLAPAGVRVNATYKLTQIPGTAHHWLLDNGGHVILFQLHGTWSRIDFETFDALSVFWSLIWKPCIYAFGNDAPGPPVTLWSGGRCQISWREPTHSPSHATFMEQVGIQRAPLTMAEVGPINETQMWAQFARIHDSTNIQFRLDFPHFDQYNLFDRP